MLVRLLLASVGGAGSFPAPVPVYDLTSAPEGGWSWFQDPRAIANGAYTYIGYNAGGDVKIAVATAGAVVNTVILHSALEYDDHDTPTMFVRPDGKLQVFYSTHIGPDILQRISNSTLASDPDLSDGFDTEQSLSSTLGSSLSTYPSPLYLTNVDGAGDSVFLFWREGDGGGTPHQWWYAGNDFSTGWSATTHLHDLTYSKLASDGVGRVDVACSNHGGFGATEIGHLYRESAAWHNSDGTVMGGSLPFSMSDMTVAYTATGSDRVWINDIALTAGGDPVIVFTRWPSDDTSDARYMYAAWNGASWDVNEICVAGGYIPSSVEYPPGTFQDHYMGGVALDRGDPQIVYASREIGGTSEMFQYTTADGGASFTTQPLTSASSGKNVRPVGVRDADDLRAVWLYGDYTNYVDYSLGIRTLSSSGSTSSADFEGWTGSTLNPAWAPVYGAGDSGFGLDSEFGDTGLTKVSVAGGILTITATKVRSTGSHDWDSACIGTNGTYDFLYGTMECEINYPQGMGVWPAFWMLQTGPVSSPPEIDILEAYPGANALGTPGENYISSTLHWGGTPHTTQYNTGSDNTAEWHTYKLVWAPGSLKFYFDGSLYFTVSSDVPSTPMYPILNLALGASGYRADGTTPSTLVMQARDMRVWEA